jgi:hypothetical protein
MEQVRYYVALCEMNRGAGPRVGSVRRDIAVDAPPVKSDRDIVEIERRACEIAGIRRDLAWIFGTYGGF